MTKSGEFKDGKSKNLPPGFIPVFDNITLRQNELSAQQAALGALLKERDSAVNEAARVAGMPFVEPIKHGEYNVAALRNELSPTAIRRDLESYMAELDRLDATALALMIASIGLTNDFFIGLSELASNADTFGARTSYDCLNKFNNFQALTKCLSTTAQAPVAVLDLSWFESRDVQAEHEGRSSGTGEFSKNVDAYFGVVDKDNLSIINKPYNENDLLGVGIPVGLELCLDRPIRLCGDDDWGEIEVSEHRQIDGWHKMTIVGDIDDTNKPKVDWLKSGDNLDISLIRKGIYGRQIKADRTRVVLFGNNLILGLQKLIEDPEVASALKPALKQELERLA